MIARREFVLAFAAAPLVSFAQTTKVWRIGFLASTAPADTPQFKAFSEGLAALGYIEGKNLKIEMRWPQKPSDRIADLAKDLAQAGVDLMFAWGTPAALAAKQSTSLIPVVFAGVADPVGSALVESLNHPGANVTGVTNLSRGLIAKLVELLTQIAPRIKRVAALRNPANPVSALQLSEAQGAANTLGLQLTAIDLNGPNDLADTFAKMRKARVEGVVVLSDPQLFGERQKIASLARGGSHSFHLDAAGIRGSGRLDVLWRGRSAFV